MTFEQCLETFLKILVTAIHFATSHPNNTVLWNKHKRIKQMSVKKFCLQLMFAADLLNGNKGNWVQFWTTRCFLIALKWNLSWSFLVLYISETEALCEGKNLRKDQVKFLADYTPPNFLRVVFHKFYLFHSWIFCLKFITEDTLTLPVVCI